MVSYFDLILALSELSPKCYMAFFTHTHAHMYACMRVLAGGVGF